MPKVRILSGNEKGAVIEMPQTEAENACATGFAELYVEPEPEKEKEPEPKRRVAKEAEDDEPTERESLAPRLAPRKPERPKPDRPE